MVLVKKYLIIVISAMFVISAAAALSATQARAYPTGWTSDSQVPGVTYGMLDIATRGPFVHLLRKNGAGRIEYCRSADYGATWGTPVVVDLNGSHEDYCPQIEVGTGNNVYIAYRTKDGWVTGPWEIAVRHSGDAGTTWDTDYWGYTVENQAHSNPELGRTANNMILLGYEALSGPTSGSSDVYFSELELGGLGTRRLVSAGDGSNSYHPAIEGEGTDRFWVAYETSGNIIAREYQPPGTWLVTQTVNSHAGAASCPDIAVTGAGDKDFVWTEGTQVYRNTYSGMTWYGASLIRGSSILPWPKVCSGSGVVACEDTSRVFDGTNAIMILTSNPYNSQHALAADFDGTHSYVAATMANGVTYVKRTDTATPTGEMLLNGQQADGQVKYIRSSFTVDLTNVVDDWNLSGTDPSGDSFNNGVMKADIQVCPDGHTWSTVQTKDSAPWHIPIDLGPMSGNQRGIRVLIYDTAGNIGTISYDPLYVDDNGPTSYVGLSPNPNAAGWNKTEPTATIASNDPSYDYSEYTVAPAGSGSGKNAGATNWTRYAGPFKVREGLWTITYRSHDKAGNVESPKTKNVYVDKTRPVCAIMRPSKGVIQTGYDSNDAFRVTGTGTDANGLTWAAIYIDNGSKPVAQTRSASTWPIRGSSPA